MESNKISRNGLLYKDNTLDYTGYNSMYCGKNGNKGDYWWWLASPSANNSGHVCTVNGKKTLT